MGLAGLIGVSLVNIFWPSPALFNVWLYGGLLLFSAFVLYDTQKIIYNAKIKSYWDPINESLAVYMDAVILFQHFLMVFMSNKNKK